MFRRTTSRARSVITAAGLLVLQGLQPRLGVFVTRACDGGVLLQLLETLLVGPAQALALGAQGIGWAVLLPLLTRMATRLDGFAPSAPLSAAPAWSRATAEVRSHV